MYLFLMTPHSNFNLYKWKSHSIAHKLKNNHLELELQETPIKMPDHQECHIN